MQYYITLAIKKMEAEKKNQCITGWVSLFNTTAALSSNNIKLLFKSIFNGTLEVKYSFFKFLSVLLFKESDNLFAPDGQSHSGQVLYGILTVDVQIIFSGITVL